MPIPTPRENETRMEFTARCMADETMVEDYDDNAQRFAICSQAWRDREKENGLD